MKIWLLLAPCVYGDSIGLIASDIYTIIPTVVIGFRIVQNENFLLQCFFALYFAQKYIQAHNTSLLPDNLDDCCV
ncbi:MAG: hypothetical protein V1917_01670 [Candidatus Gottesmanbacteria bacterium]